MSLKRRVLLSHAMGNANVRQALAALYGGGLLAEFWTSIRWNPESVLNSALPAKVRAELSRRSYPQVPRNMVHTRPWLEAGRLLAARAGLNEWIRHNESALSAASVIYALDRSVAGRLKQGGVDAVYAYEDGALETFKVARRQGIKTVYELPIPYWKHLHELMLEEEELNPGWKDTIPSRMDSQEKTDRKDAELELADRILVPCHYVTETLPKAIRDSGLIRVCPYGAPPLARRTHSERSPKLRVLYVGALTQRKGLAYLLRAVSKLEPIVECTLIGNRVGRCSELENALAQYRYIPTLPHSQVLDEMERQDVLVFPSLAEGYGLVILEALSRGLVVITTRNTGGPEVIRHGREGFFVPIRSVDAIVEKLERLASDRDLLEAMSAAALQRAQECTWQNYRELLACTMEEIMRPGKDSNCA